jgi:hypothetical protein
MEPLILIRNIVGNIALFFLALAILYIVYHVIKGAILGWDLTRWRLIGADKQKMKDMGLGRVLYGVTFLFFNAWRECIGYDGSTTWSRGGKRWEGYGTGR